MIVIRIVSVSTIMEGFCRYNASLIYASVIIARNK